MPCPRLILLMRISSNSFTERAEGHGQWHTIRVRLGAMCKMITPADYIYRAQHICIIALHD